MGPPFLGGFTCHPLSRVRRALHQFHTLVFAANQESNNGDIDQGDVGQVQNLAGAGFIHGRSYAVQITAFNPTAQSGAIDFRPFCVWS
jgi:hypothetical protein